jgi:hypothetical protein
MQIAAIERIFAMDFKSKNRRLLLIGACLALLLAFMIAALPAAANGGSDKNCKYHYRVVHGDNIYTIADQYLVEWQDIVDLNRLEFPYRIDVGQYLCIPDYKIVPTATPGGVSRLGEPGFQPWVVGNQLTIRGDEFPGWTTYYVKVKSQSFNGRVGAIRTLGGGSLEATFTLPKGWWYEQGMVVCLKDVSSFNTSSCRNAYIGPEPTPEADLIDP